MPVESNKGQLLFFLDQNFITGDTNRIREMYHNPIYKESFKTLPLIQTIIGLLLQVPIQDVILCFKADWTIYLVILKNMDIFNKIRQLAISIG